MDKETKNKPEKAKARAAVTAPTYDELKHDFTMLCEATTRLRKALTRKGHNPDDFVVRYGGSPLMGAYDSMMARTGGKFDVNVWIDCILLTN